MGKLICLINDIDYSDQFVSLQGLESTGPDVIGMATLLLRKTGGALDLNPGMTVEVYEAFNDAGDGVKERGRYFGGFINARDSVSELSSTFYTLNCVDNNILLDSIVESVNNTLTVEAATFSDQILDIVTTKTGSGGYKTRDIDAVSQVANITGASILPEVEFSQGETLREMIQKICDNAKVDNPAVDPRFFMHVDTTFGIGDVVGAAVLYVYDANLTPASSFHFKSNIAVPSGSDRPTYGPFRFKLDAAPALITKIQSYWHGAATASVEDAAAIAAYPNPYLSSGAWLAKALVDTVSNTQAEADAQLEHILAQTATPRRSIIFTSRQVVRPGEMVDVTCPQEGITAQSYRVAGVSVLIPTAGDVYCNVTLDRVEMELGAPYVIGSSLTSSGGPGGGGGTFYGIQNPHDIELDPIIFMNADADELVRFNASTGTVLSDIDFRVGFGGLTALNIVSPAEAGTPQSKIVASGDLQWSNQTDGTAYMGTHVLDAAADTGFLNIPVIEDTPTGTPPTLGEVTGQGSMPIAYDFANDILYGYRGPIGGATPEWVQLGGGGSSIGGGGGSEEMYRVVFTWDGDVALTYDGLIVTERAA